MQMWSNVSLQEGGSGKTGTTCPGGMSCVPGPQPEGGSRMSGGWLPKQH